jgi:hypothetical protein
MVKIIVITICVIMLILVCSKVYERLSSNRHKCNHDWKVLDKGKNKTVYKCTICGDIKTKRMKNEEIDITMHN